MSERINITAISEQLSTKYQLNVKNTELNQMLISTGDLIQSAIGKVETIQGREHGILGEYRVPVDKPPFWIALYDTSAVQYVEKLALEVFKSRLPKDNKIAVTEAQAISQNNQEHFTHAPLSRSSDDRDCSKCKLLKNGECGMPHKHVCGFYEPCYIPTEAEVEIMAAARQGFGMAGFLDQNALGEADNLSNAAAKFYK